MNPLTLPSAPAFLEGSNASATAGGLDAYRAAIARKRVAFAAVGMDVTAADMPSHLFAHQRDVTAFALRVGRAALFLDTGLGKTACSLVWADFVMRATGKPVLMLAPLAVGAQHLAEARRIGVSAEQSRTGKAPDEPRVVITNYERLATVEPSAWGGVILDESSILKSFTGKTTRALIEAFRDTPYRLCATATPAPNDHMEIGQHAEFLGVMRAPEMLSRWFIADHTNSGKYRLKRPAVRAFWAWVASWARCVSRPSDLNHSDAGFVLPDLVVERHLIAADRSQERGADGEQNRLFRIPAATATSIHREKRLTSDARAELVASIVRRESEEPWIVWVDTDFDADAMHNALPDLLEVRGSMSVTTKEERLTAFSAGDARLLMTKPSVAGFGLNWQHCARMAFMGISYSYESYYQAVRRCWRFRQSRPVHAHVVLADTESEIWTVIQRKSGDHDAMKQQMTAAMAATSRRSDTLMEYRPDKVASLPNWLRQ